MAKQILNREMIDLLLPYFQGRYEPNFGWIAATSALKMLPGLRAAWLMSTIINTGGLAVSIPDVTGNQRTLTVQGGNLNVQDLIPYVDLNGTTEYLVRADEAELDIIGNETYIASTLRGLSIGGWFWFDASGNQEGMITKDDNVLNRSYRLIKLTTDVIRFSVSNTGAAVVSVDSAAIPGTGQWLFAAGVYDPSTELRVYLNNDAPVTNSTAIPATLFNSNAPFELGRWAGANFMNGRQSLIFLTASALPDSTVKSFYHQTRPLFGRG